MPSDKLINLKSLADGALTDGGAWRNEAIKRIKAWLKDQLKEIDFIRIIS